MDSNEKNVRSWDVTTTEKIEERSEDEDLYLYGRFTELLLVHFGKKELKVEIA